MGPNPYGSPPTSATLKQSWTIVLGSRGRPAKQEGYSAGMNAGIRGYHRHSAEAFAPELQGQGCLKPGSGLFYSFQDSEVCCILQAVEVAVGKMHQLTKFRPHSQCHLGQEGDQVAELFRWLSRPQRQDVEAGTIPPQLRTLK